MRIIINDVRSFHRAVMLASDDVYQRRVVRSVFFMIVSGTVRCS